MSIATPNPVTLQAAAVPPAVIPQSSPDDTEPPRSPGRPRLLSPEKQQQFCNLLRLGCSRADAARAVGVSLRSAYRLFRADPDFASAVNLALCTSDSQAYRAIASAGPKSWRAAAWLIEHRTRQQQTPRVASPEAVLKSPRFQDLLRDAVCEAIIANEIALDPGIIQRKRRLAEMRSEIESRRRRGEEAVHLENNAHDLLREIAKTLKLTLRRR